MYFELNWSIFKNVSYLRSEMLKSGYHSDSDSGMLSSRCFSLEVSPFDYLTISLNE